MTAEVFQSSDMVLGVREQGCESLAQGTTTWCRGRGGAELGWEVLPAVASTAPAMFNFTILSPILNFATGENVEQTSSQFCPFLRAGPPKFKYSTRLQSKTPVVAHSL